MRKDNLKITFIKVDDLKVANYNPRKHDEQAKEQLKKSIKKYGLIDPIIINGCLLYTSDAADE